MYSGLFLKTEETNCIELLKHYFYSKDIGCPPDFDGLYCWPATQLDSFAEIQCPLKEYSNQTVTRWCSSNIFGTENFGKSVYEWKDADYSRCSSFDIKPEDFSYAYMDWDIDIGGNSNVEELQVKFYHLEQTGSILSILFLIFALIVFATFKQLRDTRVKIHINLFTAILLQSLATVTKDFLYRFEINDVIFEEVGNFNEVPKKSHFCRILMTLCHYCKLSIFSWLMIENWHFFSFISLSPYKIQNLKRYVFLGWGLPTIIVLAWISVQINASDANFCWISVDVKATIVAIPIFTLILTNFCLFLLNARIIFIKMRNIYLPQRHSYHWKWIKSSLMLAPLFGSYDIIFITWPLIPTYEIKSFALFTVRVLYSFQGFLVAVLYCFTNGQVRVVLKRAWKNWKLKREINSKASKFEGKRSIDSLITEEQFKSLDIELHF